LPFSKGLARTDFTPGAQIGSGAYGVVYKVQFADHEKEEKFAEGEKPKKLYALKELFFSRLFADNRIKEVFVERQVLLSLNHPSIIKFYCSFRNMNKLYILLEYC
jgi:3-phosphoinositide dependent protein kinase-1